MIRTTSAVIEILERDPDERLIRTHLEGRIEDTHSAADACFRLGMDDYYGSHDYSRHSVFQIEVIRCGCRMVLDEIRGARDEFTLGGGI